jgi:hypothetical protein
VLTYISALVGVLGKKLKSELLFPFAQIQGGYAGQPPKIG